MHTKVRIFEKKLFPTQGLFVKYMYICERITNINTFYKRILL